MDRENGLKKRIEKLFKSMNRYYLNPLIEKLFLNMDRKNI